MKRVFVVLGALVIAAGLALVFCGCVSTKGLSNVIRELAKDEATANITVVSPGLTVSVSRVGKTTNSVSISPNGAVSVNPKNP